LNFKIKFGKIYRKTVSLTRPGTVNLPIYRRFPTGKSNPAGRTLARVATAGRQAQGYSQAGHRRHACQHPVGQCGGEERRGA